MMIEISIVYISNRVYLVLLYAWAKPRRLPKQAISWCN